MTHAITIYTNEIDVLLSILETERKRMRSESKTLDTQSEAYKNHTKDIATVDKWCDILFDARYCGDPDNFFTKLAKSEEN